MGILESLVLQKLSVEWNVSYSDHLQQVFISCEIEKLVSSACTFSGILQGFLVRPKQLSRVFSAAIPGSIKIVALEKIAK